MNSPAPVSNAQRNRNRLTLVLIAAFFFVPMLVAGVMRFTDRHPAINRQHGELLEPKPDLRQLEPALADGKPYPWNPGARVWRIVVAPQPDCLQACVQLSHELDTVWQLFGKDADQVDILWLRSRLPTRRAAHGPEPAAETDVTTGRGGHGGRNAPPSCTRRLQRDQAKK